MGVIKYLKSLLYKSDLFCSSKILRYNDEAQYATITGGLISLRIITAILFGFSSLIIETVNKTSITSTKEQIKVANPSRIKLTAGKDNFMLGFYIETFDLSQRFDLVNGPQYFDVQVSQVRIDVSTPTFSTIKMEQFSLDHWGHHFDVRERFQSSQINKWSCLELNRTFQLAGGYGSSIFDLLSVAVYPCINSTDNHNKCANQSQIDAVYAQHTNYYVTIAFLNTVINSNQPKPISTYLDETNYAIFSKQIGIQSNLYISDYTINTDVSILPFIPVIFEHQENHEKIKKSKQVKKQKVTLEGLQIHSTIQRKPIQSTGQMQTIRFTKKTIENLNLQEQFSHQQFTASGLLKIYEDHE